MRYAVNEVLLLARLRTVRVALLVEAGENLFEAFDRVRLDVMSQGLLATAGWSERDRRRDLRINVRQSQPTRSGWPLERELNSLCNALGTWPVEEDIGEQDCSTK